MEQVQQRFYFHADGGKLVGGRGVGHDSHGVVPLGSKVIFIAQGHSELACHFPLCFRTNFGKMTPEVRVRSINFDM